MVTEAVLQQQLLEKYGPLLGGDDLARALGYRTSAAMKKAWREKVLTLNFFRIPGRRGLYCLTGDVATWLCEVASHPAVPGHNQNESGEDGMS